MKNKLQESKWLVVSFISFLLLHYLFFQFSNVKEATQSFVYSLPLVYLFFGLFSLLIVTVVILMSKKYFDNVGMVFMVATSIKIGITFFVFRKILQSPDDNAVEKINFFFLFIAFLLFETLFTIRILNKRQ